MELFEEIVLNQISSSKLVLGLDDAIVQKLSDSMNHDLFFALQKIKAVVFNDSLDDFECVEAITCILEDLGSNGGNRHDFG